MVKTIKIFDPKEIPFGALSINYKDNLSINGERYKTVKHYIYANMLKNVLNKKTIQSTNVKELKDEYIKLSMFEILNIVRKALEKAIDSKLSNNEDLINILLETKESPILYVSDDEWVGTGQSGKGMNLAGLYLMQKRRQLLLNFKHQTIDKKKQEREHAFYEAYVADMLLRTAINDGDDLSEYIGKTPSTIIDMFGRKESMTKAPPKNFIVDEFYNGRSKKELVEAIDNPESLVYVVRRNNLSMLRKRQLIKKEYIVLDMYAEYTLEKNFPELPREKYKEAIQQQYSKFGWHSKLELAKKLYELYEKGMFSERLSSNIDKVLSEIIVPTEQEIQEAEAYQVENTRIENINDFPYEKPSGEVVKIYDDVNKNDNNLRLFSMLDHSKFIKIDDNIYPTITHYLYTVLISNLFTIGSMKKAYNYIIYDENAPLNLKKFKDPYAIVKEYSMLKEKTDSDQIKKVTVIALDKKFENRVMQNILVSTNNDIIIWNDYSDPILGIGSERKGENFIGTYLMKIRTPISEMHNSETLHLITEKEITVFLGQDVILYPWIRMRIMDACKTIMHLKNYIYNKNKENVELNQAFVENALDIVYQPCSHVFAASSKVTAEIPEWFINTLHECHGFEKIDNNIATIIWKRLAVMIWYLINYLKEPNIKNVRYALLQIQKIASTEKTCIKITSSNTDDCILSAIINLLKNMIIFNSSLSFSQTIGKIDVETAVSIILNTDMKDKIEETTLIDNTVIDNGDKYEDDNDNEYDDNQYQDIYDEEHDENKEQDYGDEIVERNDDEFGDIYSPKIYADLEGILSTIPEIKDVQEIQSYIIAGMETIKNYKMSNSIKTNRINFFATQN